MITIDCSIGEGSPVRTAVGLSAATDQAVRLKNIFTNHETPGITPQQRAGAKAVADMTGAETEGLEEGSTEFVFEPDGVSTGSVTATIPDDGAVALALQPLMIAATAAEKPVTIQVEGGSTARTRAPTIHYMKQVVVPLLAQYGYTGTIDVKQHGFPPEGGAVVEATLTGADLDWIDCTDPEPIKTVRGISWASDDLSAESVAERQRMAARQTIQKEIAEAVDVSIDTAYVDAHGTGGAVQLWADAPGVGIGGSALAERDDDAEETGSAAGKALAYAIGAETPLDEHMSDQIIPFLGLTGGKVRVRDFSDRVVSNIAIARAFTPYTLEMDPDRNCITIS